MKILKIDLLFLERLQNVSLLRKDSTFVDLFLTGTSLSERCRHKTRENYHGYDDAVTEKWIPFRKTSSTDNASRHYFEMLPSICFVELVFFVLISMNVIMLDLTKCC